MIASGRDVALCGALLLYWPTREEQRLLASSALRHGFPWTAPCMRPPPRLLWQPQPKTGARQKGVTILPRDCCFWRVGKHLSFFIVQKGLCCGWKCPSCAAATWTPKAPASFQTDADSPSQRGGRAPAFQRALVPSSFINLRFQSPGSPEQSAPARPEVIFPAVEFLQYFQEILDQVL